MFSKSVNFLSVFRHLTLEAQQNSTLVIGWTAPSEPSSKQIASYQVIVDGQVQSTVSGSEKVLKATVTGFDTSRIHRVSVKSLGSGGAQAGGGGSRTSNEAACTMVIGKEAPLGPTGTVLI